MNAIKKYCIFILLINIIFLGCNNKSEKYNKLEKDFQKLKEENDKIKNQLNSMAFWPIAVAKSSKIKLGETYLANIRLAIVDTISPPVVEFKEANVNSFYDKFYQCTIIEIKSEKKGEFELPGIVEFDFCGKRIKSDFSVSYSVE